MPARAAKTTTGFQAIGRTATIRRLEDRGAIRELLRSEAAYAAFPLAYLEGRRFPLADFFLIEQNGRRALIFQGRGAPGATIQLFGDPRLLRPLLDLHPGPRSALLTCQVGQVETARNIYHLGAPQPRCR